MDDKYEKLKEDFLELLELYKQDLQETTTKASSKLEEIRNRLEDFMETSLPE